MLTAESPDIGAPVRMHRSKPVVTAPLGSSEKEAVTLMKKNKIKRLPLTKDGKIVGIATATRGTPLPPCILLKSWRSDITVVGPVV